MRKAALCAALSLMLALGGLAFADAVTGEHVACTPAHTISDNGTPLGEIPGECVTATDQTVTEPGATTTVHDTVTETVTTTAPPPPPPGFCIGCYLYAPLDGSYSSPWRQTISGVNGGTASGKISWNTDGVLGQSVRFSNPADASSSGTLAHLTSIWLNNGESAAHTAPSDDTWYRFHVRFPGNWVAAAGNWNWLIVWHNASKASSAGAKSFGIGVLANGTVPGPGTNPRLWIRPGGGSSSSPTYKTSCAPPNSLQLDHWYDIVVNVVWSTSALNGRISLWIDGQPFSAVASNCGGSDWANPVSFPTLYTNSDGSIDQPGLGIYNYHPDVTWPYADDFDELSMGPSAASVGFTP
jgi:hypothetical protein